MKIGEAAARIKLPTKTVRYYEQIGLVGSGRREDGYHDYAEKDVHELRFVSRARSLGFSVDECRRLLLLYRDTGRFRGLVRTLAARHIAAVREGGAGRLPSFGRWSEGSKPWSAPVREMSDPKVPLSMNCSPERPS